MTWPELFIQFSCGAIAIIGGLVAIWIASYLFNEVHQFIINSIGMYKEFLEYFYNRRMFRLWKKYSEMSEKENGRVDGWSAEKCKYVSWGLRKHAAWLDSKVPEDPNPEMQRDLCSLADWLDLRGEVLNANDTK